jgi:hypothetical protein
LNANEQTARRDAIAKRIRSILKAELGTSYADHEVDPLEITVFGSEPVDRDQIRLRFVADHYVYHYAYHGGSDWAEHYFGAGEIVLRGSRIVSEQFARTHTLHLTEQQADDYNRSEVRALVCAGAANGISFDAATVDVAVARMLAPAAERHAAQQRAYDDERAAKDAAERARALATPSGRCPKCASLDVDGERIFEFTRVKCLACGHSEMQSDEDEVDNWAI